MKMFSTFQAIAKVTENLEHTKSETMCNLEKWFIKIVGAMNVLNWKSIFRPNIVNCEFYCKIYWLNKGNR